MLTRLRTYLSNLIIAVVALQVLNLGLYAQNFETALTVNGKEINIINSVTEYVAEIVMQKKNAFPERKESSNQNNQNSHELLFKFQPFKVPVNDLQDRQYVAAPTTPNYNIFFLAIYTNCDKDIVSPPPKA
ncbi:hypothetical protein FC093_16885 [Ilyomonas limi]|uniref:Uncharacterized protein n=1 Tax=Ilyomonas limi TaxID=2575867 RepID=A0A4U3KXY0_9BACT|nr:hypothetical protein [Ilyomonas limi]TKK66709.1 hypothetical protein FC093_16885 [Ilyomonas limi]